MLRQLHFPAVPMTYRSPAMKARSKKIIGLAALGTLSAVDLAQIQNASAVPTTFSGSTVANPHGGSVRVDITVDAGRVTAISTPLQPGGGNASYSSFAIPTMTSRAMTALPIPSSPNVTASALVAITATIQGVSGASQISAAWKQSLQSAISSAGSAIGAQVVVTPPTPTQPAVPSTPVVTPTQPATNPTTTSSSSSTAGPAPSNSACATMPPIKTTLPEVTSAPSPEGTPTPYSVPTPSGAPTPVSTTRAGDNRVITQNQNFLQYAIQNMVKTVTKSELQTQIITCNYTATPTATPTVTVFVTVAPSPSDVPFVIKPGAGVVLKTFTCSKKVGNLTTNKVLKAKVVKCPTGYKLVKK